MSATDVHEGKSSKIRVTVLVVLLIAVVAGGLVFRFHGRASNETFCTMGLGFATVHGSTVVLQDQGGPGKDGCDLSVYGDHTDVGPTLGFDCKVRTGNGEVIDEVPQNSDGTCDV